MALITIEREAIAALDAAAMLRNMTAWAELNSGTANLDGLARVASLLGDAFGVLPGNLAYSDPAPVEAVASNGGVFAIEGGRHLHLLVRPDAAKQMLFTGHMDTVYAADDPFQSVAALDNGRIGGPGVADMKGGLAVMLAALLAVESQACAPHFGYEVVINADEETGSLSSAPLIARAARGKVAALTYEPALADGTLAGARGGTGNFSLVVRGRSAHAGRDPHLGRNALVAAADLTTRLARAAAPGLTVNPARIDGGGPNNVVPALAVLRVNFRPADAAAIALARAVLDNAVAAVAREHDVAVELHGSFNRPPKPLDAAAERLFATVKAAGADLGIPIAWKATGGVCDGNNIAAAGVPVVDTMGVRGGAIHSPEEFMIVDSLVERAALSVLTILRIARGEA